MSIFDIFFDAWRQIRRRGNSSSGVLLAPAGGTPHRDRILVDPRRAWRPLQRRQVRALWSRRSGPARAASWSATIACTTGPAAASAAPVGGGPTATPQHKNPQPAVGSSHVGTSERPEMRLGACPHRFSSCSAVRSSSPKELIVRAPSARRSRARTTEVISMIASIVGVGTASRRARSVKKTRL
jgi:hypothetical protein